MAAILLKHIYKEYLHSKQDEKKIMENELSPFAVRDFNLEIKDGEFVVLVGPSGCGKSTTLRMIAGLEDISGGELYIDGVLSNNKILDNLHKKIGTETYEARLDYIKRYSDKYTGEHKNNDVAYQARIESFCCERLSTFYWLFASKQMPVYPCKVNLLEENQKI